jgi:predicted TPR repeat methyltransferase
MPGINLKLADEFAPEYDNTILKNNWNGPEIIFNSIQDILKYPSTILDLGIGTGESSIRFKNEGHKITGLDGSAKMLQQCERKIAANKLVCHDLENPPFPFKNNTFDAILSNGVFHLVYPLSPVFTEVKRLLKTGGFFAFTYEDTTETTGYTNTESGVWKMETASEVITFKYSDEYISGLLIKNNFELLTRTRFLAFTNRGLHKDFYFTLIVAQLNSFREL